MTVVTHKVQHPAENDAGDPTKDLLLGALLFWVMKIVMEEGTELVCDCLRVMQRTKEVIRERLQDGVESLQQQCRWYLGVS